jgi:SAM-dependent methyltransferase
MEVVGGMSDSEEANRRWAEMLARWAIPEELLAAAPTSPFFFDPTVFIQAADEALARTDDSPSDAAARDSLPIGGTVLDVGVGAGAASLRLAARAGHIVGVDLNRELLDVFAARATTLGVGHTTIEGGWPGVASRTPPADVVLCHHVIYNAADLASFASALTAHATGRVVVELTTIHPLAWMAPYWEAVHGLALPDRPTVDDAIEVLAALGLDVRQQRWQRRLQMIGESDADRVARVARRLCLGADRHAEVQQLLERTPPPDAREVTTLWWDVVRS